MLQKSTEYITTEALYFRAYSSYILRKPDFKDDFGMLLDQYSRHPQSFTELHRQDVLRIKRMQDDLQAGKFSLFSGELNLSDEETLSIKAERGSATHKTICDGLVKDWKNSFRSIVPEVTGCSTNHPTPYGEIDILLLDADQTAHIIEVKSVVAKHDIIGQIMKYFIGLSLKLNYRHFYDIKMVTLCPGYDSHVHSNLRHIGAAPYLINAKTLEISPA